DREVLARLLQQGLRRAGLGEEVEELREPALLHPVVDVGLDDLGLRDPVEVVDEAPPGLALRVEPDLGLAPLELQPGAILVGPGLGLPEPGTLPRRFLLYLVGLAEQD